MAKRILIADDYESVLRRVREMLESHPDWEVCGEAVNGRDAIEKAIKVKPDVVILDFAMPRVDGLKAAAQIKAVMPEVPIVMFTMYGSEIRREVKEQKEIVRIVDKSQSGALVAVLEELLASSKNEAPSVLPSPIKLPESA